MVAAPGIVDCHRPNWLWSLLLLFALGCSGAAWAADPVGRVVLARGEVTALAADGSSRTLARRDEVHEGDTLLTGSGSAVQVRFDDGGMLSLRAETRVEVAAYRQAARSGSNQVLLRVLHGALRKVTGLIAQDDPAAFEVETPVASIGVRGTHFEAVQEEPDTWVVGVHEGGLRVYNEYGSINLGRDADFLYARTREGEAPRGLVAAPESLGEGVAGREGVPASMPEDVAAAPDLRAEAEQLPALTDAARIGPGERSNDLQTLLELADRSIAELFALSPAERAQLQTEQVTALVVGLLPDGGIVAGRGATADDGSPLIAFTLPDGREAVLRGGSAPITDGASQVGGVEVSWGRFARPRPGEGPILLIGADGEARAAVLRDDLTYAVVSDVRVADLNVNAAFRGDQAIGRASGGDFTDFEVFFNAVVDLGEGRIRDGHLLLEVAGGAEEFRVSFAGAVRQGHAELDITGGSISGSGVSGTQAVDPAGSDMQGLFTRDADGFVGGFSLRELGNRDRFAEGTFVAEPVND